MCDSDQPCAELARIDILPLLQFGDDFDEGFLKNIIGYIPVANDKNNIGK